MATYFTARVQVSIGHFSSLALPLRSTALSNMVDVDSKEFYLSLAALGYEYMGSFQALSGMKRTLDTGTAFIASPSINNLVRNALVNPDVLDFIYKPSYLPSIGLVITSDRQLIF
jgi:hypothetical protein